MSLHAFALRGSVRGEAHTPRLFNASQHAVRHYNVASIRGIPIQGRLGLDRIGYRVSAVSNQLFCVQNVSYHTLDNTIFIAILFVQYVPQSPGNTY